jgi:hypothetical protein
MMKNLPLTLAQASIIFASSICFISPVSAKEACVRNTNAEIVCGELVNEKPPTNNQPNKKTVNTKSGVDFTLEGCKKSREGLLCSVSVYNSTDYDKDFRIYANWLPEQPEYRSIIIDSEGNEYAATLSGIGSELSPKPGIGGGFSNATFPPKLKRTALLLFRPNGRLSDYIKILKIKFEVEKARYQITFRDFKVN